MRYFKLELCCKVCKTITFIAENNNRWNSRLLYYTKCKTCGYTDHKIISINEFHLHYVN